MLEDVSRVAALSKPVLIIGERGTGKELVATRLHFLSPRWEEPLVKLNCSALTESILDSELFGHEAGAFTGAAKRHIGRFERAAGGTLLLDELATIPMRMQEKILRVIEYGEFERVGGSETVQVDVRILGATNADLPALARQGTFRADLLDRLAFDVVNVPPLRARREDIIPLAEHFAINVIRELGREFFPGFTDACRDAARRPLAGQRARTEKLGRALGLPQRRSGCADLAHRVRSVRSLRIATRRPPSLAWTSKRRRPEAPPATALPTDLKGESPHWSRGWSTRRCGPAAIASRRPPSCSGSRTTSCGRCCASTDSSSATVGRGGRRAK